MTTPRDAQTATLLPSGKVLVAGGGTGNGATASAELYNPTTGTWTPTGSMTTTAVQGPASLLYNGDVLVAGAGPSYQGSELYIPATRSWTTGPNMVDAREVFTATLLLDGQVLVAGGSAPQPPYDGQSSAELFTR